MQGRSIAVRGQLLAYPAICAPLVARTRQALLAECAAVAAKRPDLIEWRVDFFEAIADVAAVVETAKQLKQAAGGLPILFTRRSQREGGERIAIGESQVVAMYREVCGCGAVDLVDFEMDNAPGDVQAVRAMARAGGLPLVLSFHDFSATPAADALVRRFEQAQALGAAVAKIAVMPQSMDDVLVLLSATSRASRALAIPIVSMAMGSLGAVTRAGGWLFGSSMTFAIGASSSAPGQMPVEDVRMAIEALRRAS